jgi:general secretion pathway protein J
MKCSERGFTLIELMIALFIFGMLAAAGVSLLSFSTNAQAATKVRLEEVAELRRLSVMLAQDLAQAVPRTSRGQGGAPEAAFMGGDVSRLLSYVRTGVSTSGDLPRSAVQRIDWLVANGQLQRIARPMADGGVALDPATVMTNVENVTLRFREKGEWRDRWAATDPRATPRALEVTVKQTGAPAVSQMFLVGAGQ